MLAELPFLGRKINLISKCDIRYEGVLYSIDPKESTIALSKVRSFGTEDRVTGRGFVPSKEEIYEYIIFRASDVKDLKLGDSDHMMGLQDPAIIQAVGPKNRSQQSGGQQQSDHRSGGGRGPRRSSGGRQQQGNGDRSNPNNQSQNNQNGGGRRPRYGSSRTRFGAGTGGQMNGNGRRSGPGQRQYGNRNNNSMAMGGQTGQQYNQGNNGPMDGHQQRQRRNSSRNMSRGGNQVNSNQGLRNGQQHDRHGPSAMSRFRRQLTGRRDSRREPLKFDGDFDFEKSNQEFAELDQKFAEKLTITDGGTIEDGVEQLIIKEESAIATVDGADQAVTPGQDLTTDSTTTPLVPAYNKERSFFDTLTCRQNVKPDWRKERRINAETFGIAY